MVDGPNRFVYVNGRVTIARDPTGRFSLLLQWLTTSAEAPTGKPPPPPPPDPRIEAALARIRFEDFVAAHPNAPIAGAGPDGMGYIGSQDFVPDANRVPEFEAAVAFALPGAAAVYLAPGPDDLVAAEVLGRMSRVGTVARQLPGETSGAARIARTLHNEPISRRTIGDVADVPTIMAQGSSVDAGAQLRHFAEGQGFSLTVDPRSREWVAIATGTRDTPGVVTLRTGVNLPAADINGTHLYGAGELLRRPVELDEAREGMTGLFGGSVVMVDADTVEIGLTSGVLNPRYINTPPGQPREVARVLGPDGAEAELVRQIFEGMGFRVTFRQ